MVIDSIFNQHIFDLVRIYK